jgi:hypothetical protein
LPPSRYNSTIVDVNPALEGGKGADGVDQFVVGFRVYYPNGPYEDENGKFDGYGEGEVGGRWGVGGGRGRGKREG